MGVCVAEQAALPGGCLQSFSRRGHAIDTGMHYIGSMQAGGIMRRYFEYFGILGSLRLRPLDEAFDVVSLPGAGDYAYMHGYEAFEKHLGELFPHEKAGLDRYCAKLREIGGSIGIGVHRTGRLSDGGTKYLGVPAAGFIGECVADPQLRNVLRVSIHNLPVCGLREFLLRALHLVIRGWCHPVRRTTGHRYPRLI